MDRVELAGYRVQQARPVHAQLLIHQPLRPRVIFDPTEAVVVPPVAHPRLIHLPRQPLPAVQADLNRKGKPGLNARVHEPEFGVYRVVIKKQALAWFDRQFQLLGLPVRPHLEAPAGFHARQHAHHALTHFVLGRDPARNLFLAHLAGRQVLYGSPRFLRRLQRGRLQLLTGLLHMFAEILE
jgi:hypothetical protein